MKRALVLISAVVLSLCLSSCVVSKRETETATRQDESIETKQASGQDKSVLIDEMTIEMGSGNDMVEHSIHYFLPMSGSCWYYGTYGDFQIEKNVDFIEQACKGQ